MQWKISKTSEVLKVAEVKMILTPIMEKWMQEIFEIEMLQGERTPLPDGKVRYKIHLSEEKAEVVRKALLEYIAKDLHSQNAKN